MFTGVVTAIGRIAAVREAGGGRRLTIETGAQPTTGWAIGDSVAVAGACLTLRCFLDRNDENFRRVLLARDVDRRAAKEV